MGEAMKTKIIKAVLSCLFNCLTFVRVYEEHFSRQYGFWRPYVEQVIYRYLDCGDPHNGFARVKCKDCGHEYLLAFSCKRRYFCPSCYQKRVVEGFSRGLRNRRCIRGSRYWSCKNSIARCSSRSCTNASPHRPINILVRYT